MTVGCFIDSGHVKNMAGIVKLDGLTTGSAGSKVESARGAQRLARIAASGGFAMGDLLVQQPGYVPFGFEFRRKLDTTTEPGFGRDPNQAITIYTHGWDEADWISPLMLVIGSPGQSALVGTENQLGDPVELGLGGVMARYHNGVWTAASDGSGRVVWNTEYAHSITASSPALRVAVRGNKRQVSIAELTRVLQSIQFE
jgi:hypothetical protein